MTIRTKNKIISIITLTLLSIPLFATALSGNLSATTTSSTSLDTTTTIPNINMNSSSSDRTRFKDTVSGSIPSITVLGITTNATATASASSGPHTKFITMPEPYTNLFTNIHGTTTATTTLSPYTGHPCPLGIPNCSPNTFIINPPVTGTTSTSTPDTSTTTPGNGSGNNATSTGTTTATSTGQGGGISIGSGGSNGSGVSSGGGSGAPTIGSFIPNTSSSGGLVGEVLGASTSAAPEDDLFGTGGADPGFPEEELFGTGGLDPAFPDTGTKGMMIYYLYVLGSFFGIGISGVMLKKQTI